MNANLSSGSNFSSMSISTFAGVSRRGNISVGSTNFFSGNSDDRLHTSILLMQQLAFSQRLVREELPKFRVNGRKTLFANNSLQSRPGTLRQPHSIGSFFCLHSEIGLSQPSTIWGIHLKASRRQLKARARPNKTQAAASRAEVPLDEVRGTAGLVLTHQDRDCRAWLQPGRFACFGAVFSKMVGEFALPQT